MKNFVVVEALELVAQGSVPMFKGKCEDHSDIQLPRQFSHFRLNPSYKISFKIRQNLTYWEKGIGD